MGLTAKSDAFLVRMNLYIVPKKYLELEKLEQMNILRVIRALVWQLGKCFTVARREYIGTEYQWVHHERKRWKTYRSGSSVGKLVKSIANGLIGMAVYQKRTLKTIFTTVIWTELFQWAAAFEWCRTSQLKLWKHYCHLWADSMRLHWTWSLWWALVFTKRHSFPNVFFW